MTNKPPTVLYFKASANLQRLIGRELVPNVEMAIIELVKNAYDAGATVVRVTIQPESEKEPGYIEILDDGQGMVLKEIDQLFMFAGYSERPDRGFRGRVPTGEKGIGIFASDKLGKTLAVFTKQKGREEGLALDINWEDFRSKKKKFGEITAKVQVGPISGFDENAGGTRLRITQLRSKWPRNVLESLHKRLSELLNPFAKIEDFQVNLIVLGSEQLSGTIRPEKPGTTDLELHFKILKDGMVRRTLSYHSNETTTDKAVLPSTDTTKVLSGLNGRFFYSMKRPSKEVKRGLNPGVRIYRDGFRIEPFGSPTADWLGISEKRAKRHGHAHIVPSRLFGFVEIFKQQHPALRDTTSRQSLIDGKEARGLVTFLQDQLKFLENTIRIEVAEPRWEKAKNEKTQKLFQARHETLSSLSLGVAHELRQPLQAIQTASENIEGYLNSTATAIPQVNSAVDVIKRNIDRIDKHIQFMKNVGSGKEDIEEVLLDEIVHEVSEAFKEQAAAQNIKLISRLVRPLTVTFNRWAILTTITNLVLNAFQAFEESGPAPHEIRFLASKQPKGIVLTVEDNGPGISQEARSRLFHRHTTGKKGGMGVALVIFRDAMKMFGGELSCTSYSNPTKFDIFIPKELKDGSSTLS